MNLERIEILMILPIPAHELDISLLFFGSSSVLSGVFCSFHCKFVPVLYLLILSIHYLNIESNYFVYWSCILWPCLSHLLVLTGFFVDSSGFSTYTVLPIVCKSSFTVCIKKKLSFLLRTLFITFTLLPGSLHVWPKC